MRDDAWAKASAQAERISRRMRYPIGSFWDLLRLACPAATRTSERHLAIKDVGHLVGKLGARAAVIKYPHDADKRLLSPISWKEK